MKCREFENKIYYYEELTTKEKAEMMEHQSCCVACNSLAEQVIQSQRLVKKVSALKAEAQNPQQLSERIMNSITPDNQMSVLDKLTFYLDSLFIRYAFSTLSLILIVFFLYEQQAISKPDSFSKIAKTEIKSGPVLNMNIFLNQYSKQRGNKESLSISRYAYYKTGGSIKSFNQ